MQENVLLKDTLSATCKIRTNDPLDLKATTEALHVSLLKGWTGGGGTGIEGAESGVEGAESGVEGAGSGGRGGGERGK